MYWLEKFYSKKTHNIVLFILIDSYYLTMKIALLLYWELDVDFSKEIFTDLTAYMQ